MNAGDGSGCRAGERKQIVFERWGCVEMHGQAMNLGPLRPEHTIRQGDVFQASSEYVCRCTGKRWISGCRTTGGRRAPGGGPPSRRSPWDHPRPSPPGPLPRSQKPVRPAAAISLTCSIALCTDHLQAHCHAHSFLCDSWVSRTTCKQG